MVTKLPAAWEIGHGSLEVAEQPMQTRSGCDEDDVDDDFEHEEDEAELDAEPLDIALLGATGPLQQFR